MDQQPHQLRTYNSIDQLPASLKQRTCTDIFCLVMGMSFISIMSIIALFCYNRQTYMKSNFPADSDGSLCGIDLPSYPYLYFANLPEISRRVCVQQCPKKQDKKLKCSPTENTGCMIEDNKQFSARFYEAQQQHTRGGLFCWPVETILENQIYKRSNLQQRNSFYNSLDTIYYSIFVAFGLSVIYFVLVQFLPKLMNKIVVIVGGVLLFAAIIVVFTYNTKFIAVKVLIAIGLIILFIITGLSILKHWSSLTLHSIYLNESTQMTKSRWLSLLYILIFLALVVLTVGLLIFQFVAFWCAGNLHFDAANQIYHEFSGVFPTIMTAILIIQLIWLLTFVKEAFNFCISGNAVHWFLEEKKTRPDQNQNQKIKTSVWHPAKILLFKHTGTVFAAAFMIGFFNLCDAFFDTIRNRTFNKFCSCCFSLFDFVRSDALAYVNLSGNPYCNSSRYCQLLCRKSSTVQFSQTSSRVYRLCAHILIMALVFIISLYMNGNISIYASLLILLESLFISTMFISYHADSAEAIQIVLLTMEELYYLENNFKEGDRKIQNFIHLRKLGIRTTLIEEIVQERRKTESKYQA